MPTPSDLSPLDHLWNQAFTRIVGSPARVGNRLDLLRDATQNYPAWLDAIETAEAWIHFESYIIHDDEVGRQFADALEAKARAGVTVRVLYDWWGDRRLRPNRLWRSLRNAGVDVRCFNPPRFGSPLAWLSRDHRKMIAADGRVAFVTGLCVGRDWTGDAASGKEPWRDTGVMVEGPAVADIERAFAETWATAGSPLPAHELPAVSDPLAGESVTLRVIAGTPRLASVYRLDQLIAAAAQTSLWLTDAYFVATTPYVQALRGAAIDGVDVRLLVPSASDIPVLRAVSRAGYRPLLEAGVRVFEWNGPMLHAKTAVADGRWARVGSTNLNPASWLGNWELDIAVEDHRFAVAMEQMYEDDLLHATEIVLTDRQRVHTTVREPRPRRRSGSGSASRAAAGAVGIGSAVGAAISNHRVLGPAEAKVLGAAGTLLLAVVVLVLVWPWLVLGPAVLIGGWIAIAAIVRAFRIRRSSAIREPGRSIHTERMHSRD
jgi:cardiolipin synthase A/B